MLCEKNGGVGLTMVEAVGDRISAFKETRLWTEVRKLKHDLIIRFAKRENRVYTQFYRFPHQLRALIERIVPALRPHGTGIDAEPLEIFVFACCSGEEAFSLSYVLRKHFPELSYRIRACDIVGDVIEKAKAGIFTQEEAKWGPFVTDEIVAEMFEPAGEGLLRVKSEIREPIKFTEGNLLDQQFMDALGQADLVFAQNVLFHMPRPQAREAFRNVHGVLKSGGALFVNGMDADMRADMSKRLGLEPLEYLIEEIHNDARVDRGGAWAGTYVGRKPFTRSGRDWLRQQGTIFFKSR